MLSITRISANGAPVAVLWPRLQSGWAATCRTDRDRVESDRCCVSHADTVFAMGTKAHVVLHFVLLALVGVRVTVFSSTSFPQEEGRWLLLLSWLETSFATRLGLVCLLPVHVLLGRARREDQPGSEPRWGERQACLPVCLSACLPVCLSICRTHGNRSIGACIRRLHAHKMRCSQHTRVAMGHGS